MNPANPIDELYLVLQDTIRTLHNHSQLSPEARIATILQRNTLNYLHDRRNATMGDLADSLHMSMSSSTQLIDRLVKGGLVVRRDDPADRRIVRISITKKGEKELEMHEKIRRDKITRLLSLIPESDIKDLLRIHKSILFKLQTHLKGEKTA